MAGATVLRVALLNLSIYQSTNCEICAIIPHRYFNEYLHISKVWNLLISMCLYEVVIFEVVLVFLA